MNFMHHIWKRIAVPHWKSRLIGYHQDEEENTNADDYPSVHMTLQQSAGE